MIKFLFIIFILLTTSYGLSQTYNMVDGSNINTCSGTFYDSGGPGGNYGNFQGREMTFCPTPGNLLVINFTAFETEGGYDELTIYNGPSTASPVIGVYSGTAGPGVVTATAAGGGCLTFYFDSDLTSSDPGWIANISCIVGPPPAPPASGTCAGAQPFCTNVGVTFPAATGTVSQAGPNYGCLLTVPSPAWYYLNIATAGNVQINLSNSANRDIDFVIWGPFGSQAALCAGTSNPPIDCGYSISANEQVDIPNAVVGQWYVMVITNFANLPTNITALAGNAAGVDGTTNCAILCNMTNVTATPGACASATNTYSVSGQITFTQPPNSGTLTVTSSCGQSVVIPGPWVSPLNYTLPGITANGGACSITATFSADPTCTFTSAYTAPSSCNVAGCNITNFTINSVLGNCQTELVSTGTVTFTGAPATGQLIVEDCQGNQVIVASAPFTSPYNFTLNGTDANGTACFFRARFTANATCVSTINTVLLNSIPSDEAGTVTPSQAGPGTNFLRVCQTGSVTITSDNNFAIPPIAPTNDPGLGYFVFSCPPLAGGVGITPTADPCFEGYYNTQNVTFTNTSGITSPLFGGWGPMTNNTFYIVPMTIGALTGSTTGVYPGGGVYVTDCYDLAIDEMTTVQFLNPIVAVSTPNCTTGSVSTTLSGGNPQFYAGNFTASNLLPATASFGNTTCLHNGAIVINGLTNGQAWSFSIIDANGCPKVISGTFTGLQNAAFTYPSPTYCKNLANPSPTITGVAGGSFTSSPAGLSINATSGLVNLAASTAGAYTITYSTPGPLCIGTATFSLTVLAQPIVGAGPDQTVCAGTAVTLSGTDANTYTWNNGITNGTAFTPTVGTFNYTVTGVGANGCTNTDIVAITVNALPIVNAGVDQTRCLGQTATLAGSGAASYSWAGPNALVNGAAFTPAVGINTYTLTGSTSTMPACSATDVVVVTVNAIPVTNAGPDVAICTGGSVTLAGTGATTYTWTGGITNGVAFSPASSGSYTVTGTTLGCTSTDIVNVTVQSNAPINAGADVTICAGASTTLVATGGVSYTFNNGLGAGNNFSVTPAATTTYTVNGTDANNCAGVDQVTITVTALPFVNAGPDQTVCQGIATTLNGSGATTYTWTGGITNGIAFTQAIGTIAYTVTGTQTNCTAIDIVNVTVNSLPTILAGVDQAVCAGSSVTLTATGAPTITWSNGVSNGVAFTPAVGVITYTATGTSAQNCVSTDQVQVTVNALPVVNGGADQTVCSGASVILTASGAATYSWTNGISNGTSFIPALGSLSYTVTGTNGNSCTNTDIVNVTVNPNPTPIINGATSYCAGTTSLLSTSIPFTSYSWNTGSINPTVNITTVNNPINVTVQNGFGCFGTSANFVVSQTLITTANSSITVCQGVITNIHGTPRSIAGTYSQTYPGGSISGCDSISNVTLIVNALPLVNAGVDQAYCTGTTTTLTGANATTYSWNNAVNNSVAFTQAVGTVNYTLTGTDANGCVNTDNVNVTVYPLPLVSAGTDFAICIGATATLVGSGATTHTWNNPILNNTAFSPISTATYTVTGTNVNGCTNTDQITVTVNQLPIINAGIDREICDDATVTLAATGATTYAWSSGVVNGVSFNPTPGTVNYTVTGTDGNGCVNTDVVQVIVNALPIIIATASDFDICLGDTETLTGTGGGVGATYIWNNGVINATSFNPAVGNVTYTVTGTNNKGCIDTDQISVLVRALPLVNAGADIQVCAGFSVTLSGAGAATYTWTNGGVNGVSFIPLSTFTYTATGTDAFGCIKTDQMVVTVNALPVVNAGVDFTICSGTSALLSASGIIGIATYLWDNGVSNGSSFIPIVTGNYVVTGTDANGCIDTDNVTITLENAPIISFTLDKKEGCTPVTVNFTNTTTGANSTIWNFSDGTTSTSNGNSTHIFTVPGCYDISIIATSPNGCISTLNKPDSVCVEEFPIAQFLGTPDVMTQILTEVQFTNTSIGADYYNWDFGDDLTGTVTNPFHIFPSNEPGSYDVILIASTNYGCRDTAYQKIIVKDELLYYVPNTFTPDDDKYNPTFTPIFTSGFDPQQYVMFIYDRWGEIIFESRDASIGWSGNYQGKNEKVQDGTYLWKIEFKGTGGKRVSKVGHVNILR